jgi:hypothetical protein
MCILRRPGLWKAAKYLPCTNVSDTCVVGIICVGIFLLSHKRNSTGLIKFESRLPLPASKCECGTQPAWKSHFMGREALKRFITSPLRPLALEYLPRVSLKALRIIEFQKPRPSRLTNFFIKMPANCLVIGVDFGTTYTSMSARITVSEKQPFD